MPVGQLTQKLIVVATMQDRCNKYDVSFFNIYYVPLHLKKVFSEGDTDYLETTRNVHVENKFLHVVRSSSRISKMDKS